MEVPIGIRTENETPMTFLGKEKSEF